MKMIYTHENRLIVSNIRNILQRRGFEVLMFSNVVDEGKRVSGNGGREPPLFLFFKWCFCGFFYA